MWQKKLLQITSFIYRVISYMHNNKLKADHMHVNLCMITLINIKLIPMISNPLKRIKQYYEQKLMR